MNFLTNRQHFFAQVTVLTLLLMFLLASCYAGSSVILLRIAIGAAAVMTACFFSLPVCINRIKHGKLDVSLGTLGVFIVASYFVIRAFVSPVTALSVYDLFLFLPAMAVAMVVSLPEIKKSVGHWLPWFFVFYIALQSIPVPFQWENPQYVPFRAPLENKEHISGFFGHRNFFGLTIAVSSLGLISYALFYPSSLLGGMLKKGIFLASSSLGLCWVLTCGSRGAWLITFIGLFFLGALWVVGKFCVRGVYVKRLVSFSLIGSILVLLLMSIGFHRLKVDRGYSTDMMFNSNSRFNLYELALQCEPDSFLFGGGARFYSYEARRVWDAAHTKSNIGNPAVVHSEFLEAYVNYGLLGFLLLLMMVLGVLGFGVWKFIHISLREHLGEEGQHWRAMQATALMGLLMISLHSVLDFSLHLLPVILFFALFLGILTGGKSWRLGRFYTGGVVVVLLFGALLAFPFVRHGVSIELATKQARSTEGQGKIEVASDLLRLGKETGDFSVVQKSAELSFSQWVKHPKESAWLKKADEAYALAAQLHPKMGVFWIMRARIAYEQDKNAEALAHIEKAIHLVGEKETRYGAFAWKALFLTKEFDNQWGGIFSPRSSISSTQYIAKALPLMDIFIKSKKRKFRLAVQPQLHRAFVTLRAQLYWELFVEHSKLAHRFARMGKTQRAMAHAEAVLLSYKRLTKVAKKTLTSAHVIQVKGLQKQLNLWKDQGIRKDAKTFEQLKSQWQRVEGMQ